MNIDFPVKEEITICFAHVAYQLESEFESRNTGIRNFQVRTSNGLMTRMPETDVLVVSGLWDNSLLEHSDRLSYIQSIGAGFDQFPVDELRSRNIRLSHASGVNSNAVSEHAMAMILSFSRQIHLARDNQRRHFWRGMISEVREREDELEGKTVGIIGLGTIGSRVAKLCKAFGMNVLATRQDVSKGGEMVDLLLPSDRYRELVADSDFIVLTCPLNDQTYQIISKESLQLMKRSAFLINVARGQCVDEGALMYALRNKLIAGAGLDHFVDDPLKPDNPLWDIDNVIITPHTGGETRLYEKNIVDILVNNLDRLWKSEMDLINQVV
tara:strand:- start:68 stop:1045 length:978 start_codon:yes stop_codon:yes gene_type:complete